MIKSIKFTEGFGYVFQKLEEPSMPRCINFSLERKKAARERYEREMEYYRAHEGGYENPRLAEVFKGRTFKFSKDRINVLFGPNGSGKTTIIKALAGTAMCVDGFTQLFTPLKFWKTTPGLTYDEDDVLEKIDKMRENSCEVDWDGVPIYYDNFKNRRSREIGDLTGSILPETADEVQYILAKRDSSKGENSLFILDKIIGIMKKPVKFSDIPKPEEYERSNEFCRGCVDAQVRHFEKMPKAESGEPNTFLFDEVDEAFDVANAAALYMDALPRIRKKYGAQIILVSHSPIVLSNEVFLSDDYNVVSMDERYTEKCRALLKKAFRSK